LIDVTTQHDKTRREVLRSGLVVIGGSVVAVGARAQQKMAQDKIDPKLVQYQTTPKDGNKCSTCVNFEPPDTCKIVSGKIDPNGWCIAFAPKQS
jgi:hypothetical protein